MTRALMHASRYHAWMFSQVEDYVGARVLEVGAGSGNLTQLLPLTVKVTALDESRSALGVAVSRAGSRRMDTVVADIADPAVAEELGRRDFDTILCSNVLEHIENDCMAAANMHMILKPSSGHLLLIVPAHARLFGSLDHAAGHFRRYSKPGLTAILQTVGFEILRARYVNALGAIAWYVNGTIIGTRESRCPVSKRAGANLRQICRAGASQPRVSAETTVWAKLGRRWPGEVMLVSWQEVRLR